jgi:hypothetical protein
MAEAVTAYRAGALRAAVNATWIALAFDLVSKVREIASAGDAAAGLVVTSYDNAIQSNNVDQLLRLESQLLDKAAADFQFIGASEYVLLKRLKEDRNRCSHPSFTSETELFTPTAEHERADVVHCVHFVVSRGPVQGKALLDQYSSDVVSTAFPRSREAAVRYVKARYLDRAKIGVVKSLAIVVAKAILKRNVGDWVGLESRLLDTLEAIQEENAAEFHSVVSPQLGQLIDSLSADQLPNSFQLLARFPGIHDCLASGTPMRLSAVVQNFDPAQNPANDIFAALDVPTYQAFASAHVDGLDDARFTRLVSEHPSPMLIPNAIRRLGESGGWRTAEHRFDDMVVPLAEQFGEADSVDLVAAIIGNSQVWDAAGLPASLAEFLERRTAMRASEPRSIWQPLKDSLRDHNRTTAYADALRLIDAAGV